MNSKDYFQQLRSELHGHPFRDRFLEELEDHSKDLIEDKNINQNLPLPHFMTENFGEPKKVGKTFVKIMNPWDHIWTLFLYGFSLWGLYFVWTLIIGAVLTPWQGPGSTPIGQPLLSFLPQISDFKETEIAAQFLKYLFLIISVLIAAFQVKKRGRQRFYKILDQVAISNFLYLGLVIGITFIYIAVKSSTYEFNSYTSILHALGILTLFWLQIRGFTLRKKSKPLYK